MVVSGPWRQPTLVEIKPNTASKTPGANWTPTPSGPGAIDVCRNQTASRAEDLSYKSRGILAER
jgi:hypothetical protein